MNQCMGCQAGWPTRQSSRWRDQPSRPIADYSVHVVVGGYDGEIVTCTADRYAAGSQIELDAVRTD